MKKLIIFNFLLYIVVNGQTETTLECPFPKGQDVSSEDECKKYLSCSWTNGVCHLRGQEEAGYRVLGTPIFDNDRVTTMLQKSSPDVTMFDDDVHKLTVDVIFHEAHHLQIRIRDSDHDRYEVPVPLNIPAPSSDARNSSDFNVHINNNEGDPFDITISRKSTGTVIFDKIGPLIYEDQFIEISGKVASQWMYGFGYNTHTSLKRTFEPRTTFPIFARDKPVGPGEINEYSHHPYFQVIEDDAGLTYSVLFFNSNAMEYSTFLLSDGSPALTLRTIGGIIDMHFFLGDSPEDNNEKYISTIGLPMLPQYWTLGFHLSRWGYSDPDHIREVRERMKALGIPQDGQTIDIDYMEHYRDFTYDKDTWKDLPNLIEELHNDGVKITLIIDPAVVIDWENYPPSQRGKDSDIFVKWMSEDLIPDDQEDGCEDFIVGYVWPNDKTVFPNFLNPLSHDWLAGEIANLHQELDFDAIWMDMNEPANFATNMDRPFNYPPELPDWSLKCPYTRWDSPPYPTKAVRVGYPDSDRLSEHTICMSSAHKDNTSSYLHYDVHSIYGWSSTVALNNALETLKPTERPVLLSRSTFPGSGRYVTHWLGDNTADWVSMKMSIIGILEFNTFGIPLIGSDICGFFNEPDMEMCARWTQLGAFYPFSRNHNAEGSNDQDPGMWPEVAEIARDVLGLRYKYLPYLYSLFYNAHTRGNTVVRPLLNVFPADLQARDIDDQFMWADGIMVAPVITQGATSRDVYFPKSKWYNLSKGTLASNGDEFIKINAPLSTLPIYVRGGIILPLQEPGMTTDESRNNDFGMTISLDENLSAKGELYRDDGVSVITDNSQVFHSTFIFSKNDTKFSLIYEVKQDSEFTAELSFKYLNVYGFPEVPTIIDDNGSQLDFAYNSQLNILSIICDRPVDDPFEIIISV